MQPTRQPAKTITAFQHRVYEGLALVPRGSVTTYGALASQIGCGSAQAVGQALRRNPFAPEVPCHRVVRADGSLGGFFGKSTTAALQRKRQLLEAEGVCFDSTNRVERCFIL
jgi:methylated-DNA-[protein]-cysteine S-methyltransferase